MATPDNTPVLIGTGQVTWRDGDSARTPVDALTEVSSLSLEDTGAKGILEAIDAIAMVRFIADTDPNTAVLFPRNPGRQVAERLGINNPALYQGIIGGNTPQYLVNHFARQLARGRHGAVLISGAELLATLFAALGGDGDISAWPGDPEEEPTTIGTERDGLNAMEMQYGLYEPINTYPLFENSLRHELGASPEEHQDYLSRICSAMSQVGAGNPHAWKPDFLTSEEVGTVTERNRYIGYPYTKAMNPILAVDMAASVVMTTVGKARELGIDPKRWVYLRGGVDVNDIWHPSERPVLHESPAIRLGWQSLSQSGAVDIDAITDFDIYSCFPSAVQVACREMGLSPLDVRGVTITGGLPYLGGPGNNYSLHAIAQMVTRLRNRGEGHGLVTANGLYLTKHSLGLYSTEPGTEAWPHTDDSELQQRIDNGPKTTVAKDPEGPATIETFTVSFDRNGPKRGIVIARNAEGERIIANTRTDAAVLEQLIAEDPVGHGGQVTVEEGLNCFEL